MVPRCENMTYDEIEKSPQASIERPVFASRKQNLSISLPVPSLSPQEVSSQSHLLQQSSCRDKSLNQRKDRNGPKPCPMLSFPYQPRFLDPCLQRLKSTKAPNQPRFLDPCVQRQRLELALLKRQTLKIWEETKSKRCEYGLSIRRREKQ